jgi:hypothetical protein
MTLRYTVRPLSDRTWLRPAGQRERSRFTASWTDTLTVLERELGYIGGRDLVIEIDIREQDLRLDGTLRANARPATTDAVVVAFESTKGPLQYRSDIYDAVAWGARGAAPWQHNVRAVALTLEALRAVGRYGASALDEQYRGYKAIGDGREPGLDLQAARALIDGYGGVAAALKATHPDTGGDPASFQRVQEARRLLGGGQ